MTLINRLEVAINALDILLVQHGQDLPNNLEDSIDQIMNRIAKFQNEVDV